MKILERWFVSRKKYDELETKGIISKEQYVLDHEVMRAYDDLEERYNILKGRIKTQHNAELMTEGFKLILESIKNEQ